ncbi:hypothetical protein JL720_9682 [Aureococcus anophagefferens]|nr:hypothetical protein JL720_9682 [Aureococcus anophagefferens]
MNEDELDHDGPTIYDLQLEVAASRELAKKAETEAKALKQQLADEQSQHAQQLEDERSKHAPRSRRAGWQRWLQGARDDEGRRQEASRTSRPSAAEEPAKSDAPALTAAQDYGLRRVCRLAVKPFVRSVRVVGAPADVAAVLTACAAKAKAPLLGRGRGAKSLYEAVAAQLAAGHEVVVVEGVDAATADKTPDDPRYSVGSRVEISMKDAELQIAEIRAVAAAVAAKSAVLVFSTTDTFADDALLATFMSPIVVDVDDRGGGGDEDEAGEPARRFP